MNFIYGNRISAFEKNELKRRAIEMVLLLFYIEDLKKFVVASIRTSSQLRGDKEQLLPEGTKGLYKEAWKILVTEKVLTQDEVRELEGIINYRNLVAHQTQDLTKDIGRYGSGRVTENDLAYDFNALKRIRYIRDKVFEKMAEKFVISISFRGIFFDAAEKAYNEELSRLQKRIKRQLEIYEKEVRQANSEIDKLQKSGLLDELMPYHPKHVGRNGVLSKSGIACCKSLFEAGASPYVVAHLMNFSVRSINKRHLEWKNSHS